MALRVFASHDWGKKGGNHARVRRVVHRLLAHQIRVWFDETHMHGNMVDAMCKGIDRSDVVLVFVTRNYMRKVEDGDDTDNVRREFMYAAGTPDKFVVVKFEELPDLWTGPVRMLLGAQKYVDMTEITEASVKALVDAVRRTASTSGPPRSPPAFEVRGAQVLPPVRQRVERIVHRMGGNVPKDVHTVDLVNQLLRSIVGPHGCDAPLVTKLHRLECELGI